MNNNYLEELNTSQREAVEYIDGASLVIAGAGSGKTRVLTYKIAYLLQSGLQPWEIMALTFTNKAAAEMKERICLLVGDTAVSLQMGTFHSIFARILRKEAAAIGYDSNFTIYDESDSRSLCKMLIKQLELDEKVYKPADVHCRISDAKNKLISPEAYADDTRFITRDVESRVPEMSNLYRLYVQSCRKSNAMDFDDLLVNTFELFQKNEDIRRKYVERFRFVLVDEYQDTNYAQQQIVWQLTKERQHVCVVGDDAQSIYGFRGANIDNILDFQQLYEGSRLFKLEQNYRSTQRIVQAANSLIRHNNRQIPKDVYSRKDEGDKLVVRLLTSDKEEAITVCKEIRKSVKAGEATWRDFAILYRTNYQSRTFEEQMLKDNIPYRIFGGMSFYQRKEIKDVMAYFRLVVNPYDEEALRRVINYPGRGIGDTTVSKLLAASQAYGVSLWEVAENPSGYGVKLQKKADASILAFREMIIGFSERIDIDDAFALGEEIVKKSGISEDIYGGHNVEDVSRQENLEEFLASMQDFVESNREEGLPISLLAFLQDVQLLSDKESGEEDDTNKVSLMTIHSAKGLEFPMVFVVGMEENIFPSPLSCDSMRALEEERRLLYVAITRAEKRCILTSAKSRFRYGKMEFDAPSRFLRDIDPTLLRVEDNTASDDSYMPKRRSNPEYSVNTPYIGSGYGYQRGNSRMQNSKPVASQFMADQKPMITSPRRPETPVNPFSPSFEAKLHQASGRPVPSGSRFSSVSNHSSSSTSHSSGSSQFAVGDKVEHARFGIGFIKSLEGTGDNAKATVDFNNSGTKQLLLKFAKLKRL